MSRKMVLGVLMMFVSTFAAARCSGTLQEIVLYGTFSSSIRVTVEPGKLVDASINSQTYKVLPNTKEHPAVVIRLTSNINNKTATATITPLGEGSTQCQIQIGTAPNGFPLDFCPGNGVTASPFCLVSPTLTYPLALRINPNSAAFN